MKYAAKEIALLALVLMGLGAAGTLAPASAHDATFTRLQRKQQRAKRQRLAAQTARYQQNHLRLQLMEQQRQVDLQHRQIVQQQQQLQQLGRGYAYGFYDQYGCPPGTGYSILLGRCGDLSELFTQFQGR